MRVEQEGRDAKREDGDPEVNQVGRPYCQCDVEQGDKRAHAEVDAWSSKAREQDAEIDPSCSKPTTCCDISSSTKR